MLTYTLSVTRSHKFNDKDHAAIAEGTAVPQEHLPHYFAKSGHAGVDPKKTKKNGGGKGNWGHTGDEVLDSGFNLTNARRRSNSSGYANGLNDFKTKFDINEQDPVFEEEVPENDDEHLSKTDTTSSSSSSSHEKA
ncbi:hypothetical protein MKZ38_004151 [Zalerion maritima]|uniref:STF2-like protein n=1 Tax=Zalerion maritima TaxID=339359 RepID=A0AAD5WRA3_9PEZI|nr:hypothetical protein MKZ38_004151 [Zalerion maritima]